MKMSRNIKAKKILITAGWIIIACAGMTLLVAAVRSNESKKCKGVNINISGVNNHFFIDKKDVENIITRFTGKITGNQIKDFDLKKMEDALKREIWIRNAEMYFDNNGMLQVIVDEREPVARIFTLSGATFYIDSSLMMLPLSEKLSARLPVFTGFPSEAKVLKKSDSLLLKNILHISQKIQQDEFLMAMIEQVDITWQRNFELIPKIGNQLIVFGDGNDIDEKFRKLSMFYKTVLANTGWNKYSVISLQYDNQLVARIRGSEDVIADSLRTLQLLKTIAENAEKMAEDSIKNFVQDSEKNTTDSTMVLQSVQRDEGGEPAQIDVTNTVVPKVADVEKPVTKTELKAVVKKPITNTIRKPVTGKSITTKPKAVMPKAAPANEY